MGLIINASKTKAMWTNTSNEGSDMGGKIVELVDLPSHHHNIKLWSGKRRGEPTVQSKICI